LKDFDDRCFFLSRYPTTTTPKTLQELGFRYVNMDASWDSFNRSSTGAL